MEGSLLKVLCNKILGSMLSCIMNTYERFGVLTVLFNPEDRGRRFL
jgi:hypothetical protein